MIRLIFSSFVVLLLFGAVVQAQGVEPVPGSVAVPTIPGASGPLNLEVDGLHGTETEKAVQKYPELAEKFGVGFQQCDSNNLNCGGSLENVKRFQEAVNAKEAEEAQKSSKEVEAVKKYVSLNDIKGFSLSDVSVENEQNLVIDNSNNRNNILYRIIRVIAMLVGTVAILLYVIGGYFLIISQGDENQLTKGKQIVTYTSIGLVLVFGAFIVVQLVMGIIYSAA